MSSRGRSSIDPAGGQPYAAAAMSLVFHSAHPLVPTLRADVRLFQVRARRSTATGAILVIWRLPELVRRHLSEQPAFAASKRGHCHH